MLRGWLFCIGFSFGLLLVDEVIKFFMRRSHKQQATSVVAAPAEA